MVAERKDVGLGVASEDVTVRITPEKLRKDSIPFDRMELIALEGERYTVRLYGQGKPVVLSDGQGRSLLYRSTREALDELEWLAVKMVEVVHHSAYGEMIGLDGGAVEPLRIRIRGRH